MYKLEDKKIIFDKDFNFKKVLPLIGYGSHSDVYKIKIGNEVFALKVFNGLRVEHLKNYKAKLNINIESYISPIRILYIDNKFKGYLMKFCKGKDLEKRKLDMPVEEFALSSTKLINDTKKLTILKYNIYDTFISNVMYDEGFKMIDMDDYPYESSKTLREINDINSIRLNQLLVNVFLNSTGLAGMFFQNVEMTKLMSKCTSGKITFEELFNTVCTMAYNVTDEEINKVSEIGKVLKKSKNI